jgi:hypothetical protein
MGKKTSSRSQMTGHSMCWEAGADFDGLITNYDGFIENLGSLIDDRLICVHVNFGFYCKCTSNRQLLGELMRAEGARIMPELDGGN